VKHVLLLAHRILRQLASDRRFLGLSIIAPLLIIFFLKTVFDTFGPAFPSNRYIVPTAGFIVHFLSFILCAILVVRERNSGTMERMFVSGFKRFEIISGYTLGYLGLATLQSLIVLTEVLWLFHLSYSAATIASLFLVFWVLSIVSVMLGIFVSTFARNEAQVFPFIPLIILPSVFFSGLMIDASNLPSWAYTLGHIMPLYYAIQVILELIKPGGTLLRELGSFLILIGYGIALLAVASRTLKQYED
jgi:ABC-2 type transport system permease protein